MPGPARHLRVDARATSPACRGRGCWLAAAGTLGYCPWCYAVYIALRALHERHLAAYAARIADGYGDLVGRMTPAVQRAVLAHLGAHAQPSADGSFRFIDGIADRVAERPPHGGEIA